MTSAHDEIWVDLTQFDTRVADGLWDGTASDPDAPGWYGEVRALIRQARGPAEPDELLDEPLVVESMRRVTVGAALIHLHRSAGARTFGRLVAMKVAAVTTASVVGVATAAATSGIVATVVVPAIEEHVVPMIEQLAPAVIQPNARGAGTTVVGQAETGAPAGAEDASTACAAPARCEPGGGEPAPAPVEGPAGAEPAPSARPEPVETAQPVVPAGAPVETSAVPGGAPGQATQVDPETGEPLADATATTAPPTEASPDPSSSTVTPLADPPVSDDPPASTGAPADPSPTGPTPPSTTTTSPTPTSATSTGTAAVPPATGSPRASSRQAGAASTAGDVHTLATETSGS
jgi:hypothetical protein